MFRFGLGTRSLLGHDPAIRARRISIAGRRLLGRCNLSLRFITRMCIFSLGRLCVRANMLIRPPTSSASYRAGDRDGSTNLIQRRILVISESKSTGHALRVRPSRHGEVRRDAFERDEREAARTTAEIRVLLKSMLYRARHNEPTERRVEGEGRRTSRNTCWFSNPAPQCGQFGWFGDSFQCDERSSP